MNHLGVLARHWTPGEVKTRLAATIGPSAAARFHLAFLTPVLRRLDAVGDVRRLNYTPLERAPDFESLAGKRWQCSPQVSGDLGQRMRAFFETAFSGGARRAVLIGADSPTLPVEYVELA